jgi:hypothetical protein
MNRIAFASLALLFALGACQHTKVQGSGGAQLGLTEPANQWLRRGQSNNVAIQINRDNFDGPVDVNFSNLPAGVSVGNPGPIPAGDFVRNYTLTVGADAPLVKQHPVTVTASARDMRVTQTFNVDVGN